MEEKLNNIKDLNIKDDIKITNNKKLYIIICFLLLIIIFLSIALCIFILNDVKEEDKIAPSTFEDNKQDICLKYQNNKCILCNKKYKLINDECKPLFSFKSIYETENKNENIELINKKFKNNILEMEINEEKVNISTNFTFRYSGNYTVYILMNITNLDKLTDMFYQIKELTYISFTKEFDTKNIKSIRNMFYECKKLTSIDISNFNTENMIDIGYLFYGCSSLSNIDITNFNTKKTTVMISLFNGCSSLTSIDLSKFNTEKVTHINNMFKDCSSLSSIDLSNFNTENVIYIDYLFSGCSSLTSIDLSNFRTPKVKTMNYVFNKCKNLKYLDISHFSNTSRTYYEFCSFISSKGGIIKVNKYLISKIQKFIPKLWEIILIDN